MTGLMVLCGLMFAGALLAGAAATAASSLWARRGRGGAVPRRPRQPGSGTAGTPPGTVSLPVGMDVVLAERAVRSVPVVLRYDLSDPYAVTLEFHLVPGQEVRWVVGRDLVARGLRAPAGVGDVQIRPSGSRSTRSVRITLTSPEGHAVVLARAADLEGFLRTTAELCPPGSEGDRLDVDGALGSLLTP